MKALAADLDMAPSTLSAASTLGDGDHVRFFPADRLVDLMKLTDDFSILSTMANQCGYELRPMADRMVDELVRLREDIPYLNHLIAVLEGGAK
jgi:hypothetical protein